jgi:ParB family chromosome partitioning protein
LKKNLSVRQVEAMVRSGLQVKKPKKQQDDQLPLAYRKVQDRLAAALSTNVKIKHQNSGKGQIVINYYSDDDLNRILDTFEDEM